MDIELIKTGKRRCRQKPVIKIDEQIDYAVVHKTRENRTVKKVETRIIFGNEQRIKERLEKSVSNKINTSYVECSKRNVKIK